MNINTNEADIEAIFERGTIVKSYPSDAAFKQALLSGKKLRFYIGFDATGATLHLSHAKNFMLLEKFRALGHEVIVLFGDFTARLGDPSGKSAARQQLTRKEVLANVERWKALIAPLMDFEATENPPLIKYNHDWLSKLTFEDVIGLASNFTVQQMLERDMFQQRLSKQQPIHLHEFLYPLMQGYDSVAMDVDVELCGTDQTFNALAGRTLLKKLNNKEKFVVTVTLMEDPKTGVLMSKSNGTGVFIDATPHDLFGQIMAQSDEMMPLLFRHNTFVSLEEIDRMLQSEHPRDAKLRLAHEITTIFHGSQKADEAQAYFVKTISRKETPDHMDECTVDANEAVSAVLLRVGFVDSKAEARRVIAQGGVKIDGEPVIEDGPIGPFVDANGAVLQKGKRQFVRVRCA